MEAQNSPQAQPGSELPLAGAREESPPPADPRLPSPRGGRGIEPSDPPWPLAENGWPAWPPPASAVGGAGLEPSLLELLHSGDWGRYDSPVRSQLARSLERFFGVTHARPTCSGTAAVELALRAAGVGPGTDVILAAYDFPGNFRTIELLGARPLLVDVVPGGVTIDVASIDALPASASGAVRAVIASHLHGHLVDMGTLAERCRSRRWVLIEDVCQAPGAGWPAATATAQQAPAGDAPAGANLIRAGALGDFATLSFGGSKLLTAGNGGAVLTSSDRGSAKLDALIDRPSDAFPLSPLQCAVLLPQLDGLDRWNARRATAFRCLNDLDWSPLGCRVLPLPAEEQRIAAYKFPLVASSPQRRDQVLKRFASIGLPAGPGFRSLHGTSDRRSFKPVPLEHAAHLSDHLIVIDHRALLAEDVAQRVADLIANRHDTVG